MTSSVIRSRSAARSTSAQTKRGSPYSHLAVDALPLLSGALEGRHLHDPVACLGSDRAVAPCGGDGAVLRDVAVGFGDDACGETGPGPGEASAGHSPTYDQLTRDVGGGCAAVGLRRAATGRVAHVERVRLVEAAVLEDTDVGKGDGLVELHRDCIAPRTCRLNVPGVVDGLAETGAADGRRGDLIGVPGAVGDRRDVAGRIVPADQDDVQVSCALRLGEGRRDGALRALRRGALHLDERDRWRR